MRWPLNIGASLPQNGKMFMALRLIRINEQVHCNRTARKYTKNSVAAHKDEFQRYSQFPCSLSPDDPIIVEQLGTMCLL